jgi:hypothetical protein
VIAAEPFEWPCHPRLLLRNHVCPEPEAMLASGARFLVVHRDPLAEEHLIEGGEGSGSTLGPQEWEELARTSARTIRRLQRRWKAPFYRDDRIVVWDLDAVRRRSRAPRPAARSGAESR